MSAIHTQHYFRVDLDSCPLQAELPRPMSHTDALADEIVLAVRRGTSPVELAGMTVLASLTNAERRTLPLTGRVQGNLAILPLPAEAYAVPGCFTLTMQLISGETRHTVMRLRGEMERSSTDSVISPGEILPGLPEMLQEISAMRQATQEALQAAEMAREAAIASAPVIRQELRGGVLLLSDAANRPAISIRTLMEPSRSGLGEPSPESATPLSPRGSITLQHGDSQITAQAALTAQLPQSCWAGTMDWLTGEFTLTHARIVLDGSTSWQAGTNNIFVRLSDIAPGATLFSDQFADSPAVPVATLKANQMRQGADARNVVFGNPGNALSVADWAARAAEAPITLVYTVKEPQVLRLTPQTLTLLEGENAIFSDEGVTEIVYSADTRRFIEAALK